MTNFELDDGEDPFARVGALLELGKSAEAIRLLAAALASDPEDTDLLTQLAWAHFQLLEYSQAEVAAQNAIASDPEHAPAHRALAWARWNLGDRRGALVAARTAAELDPESAHAWSAIAFIAGRMGRRREARRAGRKATALEPESPEIWLESGAFGQSDEELEAQRRALELAPEVSMSNNNYGYGLLRRGRFEEAVAFFEKALELDPGNRLALGNLARALRHCGRVEEALAAERYLDTMLLRETDSALENDPNTGWALRRQGWLLVEQGKKQEGLELLRRACDEDPENASTWSRRSNAELAVGNVEEARRAAEKVIVLEPDFPDGLEVLADIAVLAGDPATARACASELEQRFAGTDQMLAAAASAALAEGELELAEKTYRDLLRSRATDCCTHALLGLTLTRAGEYEAARASLETAKISHPACPKIGFVERELDAVRSS